MAAATRLAERDSAEEQDAVRGNRRRALAFATLPGLVAGVVVGAVLAAVGLLVVGAAVLVLLLVVTTVLVWRTAPGIVLRALGARPSDEDERPRLHNLVDGLCATMGLPRPALFVVDSPVPNAMTVGREPRSASLVVTSGLVDALSLVELEGVLAHELVHVKRYDTVAAGVAVAVAAPLTLLGAGGASLVHAMVGKGREYAADQRAAVVVRYPPGLGAALEAMASASADRGPWPPGGSRLASSTRWLWIDPTAGARPSSPGEGGLDDTSVRAAALALH